jgi:hypothetical protein
MKIMLIAFIMMCFVGAELLKLEKSDPAHTQNFTTTTANAIAENVFYYTNTAFQYAADTLVDSRSSSPISIDNKMLDDYMLDKKARTAQQTFEPINEHLAYVASSDVISYIVVIWQPFDFNQHDMGSYHPLGIAEKSYTALNFGIIGELTRIVNLQNVQLKSKFDKLNYKGKYKYLPYVVGVVVDKSCSASSFQIYSAETQQIDDDGIKNYTDIYINLCKVIKAPKGSYIIFKRITSNV